MVYIVSTGAKYQDSSIKFSTLIWTGIQWSSYAVGLAQVIEPEIFEYN